MMSETVTISRRRFLSLGSQLTVGGSMATLLTACSVTPKAAPPPRTDVSVDPFQLRSDCVVLEFGPRPSDTDSRSITPQVFMFRGQFNSVGPAFISGSANVQLPTGGTAELRAAEGLITVIHNDLTLEIDPLSDSAMANGRPVKLTALGAQLAKEASPEGFDALSETTAALVIYGAFWGTRGITPNVNAARTLNVSDDEYSWWCNAWATAGAIAMTVLGAVGCALLLAGCVGTVVLGPLGAVSCVTASVICSLIASGLTALVAGIAELLWAHDEAATT